HVRGVLVSRGSFTLQRVRALADQFVQSERHDAVFAEVLFGSERVEFNKSHYGTVPRPESTPTFCDTLAQLRIGLMNFGVPVGPIARVVAIGNAALFSYRD